EDDVRPRQGAAPKAHARPMADAAALWSGDLDGSARLEIEPMQPRGCAARERGAGRQAGMRGLQPRQRRVAGRRPPVQPPRAPPQARAAGRLRVEPGTLPLPDAKWRPFQRIRTDGTGGNPPSFPPPPPRVSPPLKGKVPAIGPFSSPRKGQWRALPRREALGE